MKACEFTDTCTSDLFELFLGRREPRNSYAGFDKISGLTCHKCKRIQDARPPGHEAAAGKPGKGKGGKDKGAAGKGKGKGGKGPEGGKGKGPTWQDWLDGVLHRKGTGAGKDKGTGADPGAGAAGNAGKGPKGWGTSTGSGGMRAGSRSRDRPY